MKPELVKMYRKVSPRIGSGFEPKWVPRNEVKRYVAAGYIVSEKPKKRVKK